MHASIALIALAAALQTTAKPAPAVPASGITAAPAAIDAVRLQGRDVVSTIPFSSCTLFVECCQQVLTVPVIPASFAALLPTGLTAPVPFPTLGPVVGLECTPTNSDGIKGSSCLAGGSPMCCQQDITDLFAEGCQPVVNNPPSPTLPTLPIPTSLPISLPGLPTISVPGLPISIPLGGSSSSSSSGLLGLPLPSLPLPSLPLGGDPAPTTSSGLLGLPLPSLPLGGSPTSSSSGLLGLPLPSLPLGGSPTSSSSGLLGLPLPSLPLGGSPTPTTSSLLGIPLPSLPLGGSPSPTSSSLLGLPIPSLPLGLASEAPAQSV
ncbi:hypothetical protein VTO73DRAFT_6361 [Trametes versicolor]